MKILIATYPGNLPQKNRRALFFTQEAELERNIYEALLELGHEPVFLGVHSEFQKLFEVIECEKPNIVFNLLDEFSGEGLLDQHIASFFELYGVPYTGCNPRGLLLSRDKLLSKKIVEAVGVKIPKGYVASKDSLNLHKLDFPCIVKSLTDDGSKFISQNSVVKDPETLHSRIEFLKNQGIRDVLVEEYIDGREVYVSVLGNERISIFHPWEAVFEKVKKGAYPIASYNAKWNKAYQRRNGLDSKRAELSDWTLAELKKIARLIYQNLYMSGYGRLDFRIHPDGQIYFIEANANPHIGMSEDYAQSAKSSGVEYLKLIEQILNLAMQWKPTDVTKEKQWEPNNLAV